MFYPNAVVLPGPIAITQLNDLTPAHNFGDMAEIATGDVAPTFVGTHSAQPDVSFRTTQVKSILDAMNLFGICKDFSAGNVDLEYKAGTNRGTREADGDSDHLRLRMEANAYLSWQSLRCDAGGLAEIACRLVPVYDGVNDPLVPTAGVALTATAVVGELFTLGPVKINGTTLDLVQGFNWENNIQYDEHLGDVGFFNWSGVKSASPVITVRSRKSSYLATYGTRGTALSSCTIFLRRKVKAGINVANATATNISLAPLAGTIKARSLGQSGEVEIAIHLERSSSSFFTLNSAVAVT